MFWIEAVHRVDGDPILRTQYWTRSSLSPAEIREIAAGGLTAALWKQIVGADMYYTWRSFDAIAADRRNAAVLDVPVGSPLLQRCGLNSDVTGRPLLYLQRDAPSGRMRTVVPSHPPQDRGR
jgi:DNA-binding GntR family transcriptional regulator